MRNLRTNLSCLAVLAGIAAVSIAATSGSAFAAKGLFRRAGLRHEGGRPKDL